MLIAFRTRWELTGIAQDVAPKLNNFRLTVYRSVQRPGTSNGWHCSFPIVPVAGISLPSPNTAAVIKTAHSLKVDALAICKTDPKLWKTSTGVQYWTPAHQRTCSSDLSCARAMPPPGRVEHSRTTTAPAIAAACAGAVALFASVETSRERPAIQRRNRKACISKIGFANQYCSVIKHESILIAAFVSGKLPGQ